MAKTNIYRKLYAAYKKLEYDPKDKFDKVALRYMKDSKSILDVGCGVGRFISKAPQQIKGVDNNIETVEICQKKGFSVVKGDVTKLPFEDNSFDGVYCSHVIEHLYPEQAHRLLYEMARVLKKGGIFVIGAPLLHSGFYDDFTHIKPYHPKALRHYLVTDEKINQTTMLPIKGRFKMLKLKYRRAQLFSGIEDTSLFFLTPIFNVLYRLGISSLKKTGYMMILRKI